MTDTLSTGYSPSDLPPLSRRDGRPAPPAHRPGPEDGADLRLEHVERVHVTNVLERTGWTIEGKKGAAALLGLAPSTLRSRMAQLAIERPKKG